MAPGGQLLNRKRRCGVFEARYTLVRKAVQFAHLARNSRLCSANDDQRSLRLIAASHQNVSPRLPKGVPAIAGHDNVYHIHPSLAVVVTCCALALI